MKPLLAGAVLAAALAGAAPAASPKLTPARQGLCQAGETVIYSCRFGARTGSVCGAPGRISYRFGLLGKAPELDIASTRDWSNIHRGGNRSQGGLNQDYLRFTNGSTHYVIHSDVTGSLNESPGRRSSGIVVLRGPNAAELANLDCKTAATAPDRLSDFPDIAPPGWDGEDDANGPFDQIY